MKKYFIICAAMAVAVSFTSCKSSESAYKKAYEKAQAAEQASYQTVQEVQSAPVVPVVEKPVVETTVVETDVPVRQENVSMISGSGLKAYSVVVGSFGVQANAERLQTNLRSQGYNAQIVRSASNMYRVVAATSENKSDVIAEKSRLRSSFADAWILLNS